MSKLLELREQQVALKIEKLRSEVSYEAVRAEMAQFELAAAKDREADRLAKPGSREFRQLDIIAPIYGPNVDTWIGFLEHWERRDPGGEILVRINSPGGSVIDGFALFDTILRLRRKGHHVVTHGLGMIASMATLLMQAGDERVLDANSWFMIHEIASGVQGKMSEMEDSVKLAKRLENRIIDIMAERSTLTVRQIKTRIARKDDWMSAEEAVKFGFADRIE